MIYGLLTILILIFCAILLVDKDIFSPSVIICESYILAVICAIASIKLWGIDLSSNTVKIIVTGVLAFIIPSYFVLHTHIKRKVIKEDNQNINNNRPFEIDKKVYVIFLILQLLTVFLYLYYVIKTVGGIGNIFNLSSIMNEYREGTSYGDMDSLIPSYVNQLVKISQIIAYISIYYVFYKKIILNKKNNLLRLNILSIILYIALTLLSGGRYKMISFFIGGLLMWNLIRKKISNKKLNIKNTLKIFSIILIVLFIFSQTRTLVGRTSDEGIISYISSYFGGSIQLFDLFLKNPTPSSNILGKETFYAINNFLSKLGLVETYRMHLEFRSSNGIVIGNVYTALRCFYYDFGIAGVIVLQSILSIIWTKWYKKIIKNKEIYNFDSILLFYCMFANCLFFNSYRDNFFSGTVSVSTITIIIYFIIIKKILIHNDNKK